MAEYDYMHLSEEEAIVAGFALRGYAKGITKGVDLKDVNVDKEGIEVFYMQDGEMKSDYLAWSEWGPKLIISYLSCIDGDEMRRILGD